MSTFPGARGPSEFWGNKADFDGSTGYLARTSALTGVSDGKVVSGSFWINADTLSGIDALFIQSNSTYTVVGVDIYLNGSALCFDFKTSGGGQVLLVTSGVSITSGTSLNVQFCFDMTDTGKRCVYINGSQQTPVYSTYANSSIYLTAPYNGVGGGWDGSYPFDGKLSEFYFTTDYIDFSQEANRLKFRDCFGAPTNLPALIEAGEVPTPQIYLRFDPSNQGKNYGTGGDFTVNGSILDGGQL